MPFRHDDYDDFGIIMLKSLSDKGLQFGPRIILLCFKFNLSNYLLYLIVYRYDKNCIYKLSISKFKLYYYSKMLLILSDQYKF